MEDISLPVAHPDSVWETATFSHHSRPDGYDPGCDGSQPRLLGSGTGDAKVDGSRWTGVRDDQLRRDASLVRLWGRIGGQGGPGVAHPATRDGTGSPEIGRASCRER